MFYFCLPFFLLIYTIEDKERKIELLLITEKIPFRRNKNPKPPFNNVAETYSTDPHSYAEALKDCYRKPLCEVNAGVKRNEDERAL